MKKIFTVIIVLCTTAVCVFGQNWEVVGEMPEPVYGGEAVAGDSVIYILGGFSETNNSGVDLIQEYNPQTKSWRTISNLKSPRFGFFAGLYNNKIIVVGGQNNNSIEFWDLNSKESISFDDDAFQRSNPAGAIVENNLYLFGGGISSSTIEFMVKFDLLNDSISETNNFYFPGVFPDNQIAAAIGSDIYLFGGVFIGVDRLIYKYNVNSKMFIPLSMQLNAPRAGAEAVEFDNKIYIIGGFNETNSALSTVEIFNPMSALSNGPLLNIGRSEPLAVSYKGSIYVFGGKGSNGHAVTQIEKLQLVTDVNDKKIAPQSFSLENNFPNPFNPSTRINFSLNKRSFVSLKIYDVLGNEVCNLLEGKRNSGNYKIDFNPAEQNLNLSSGVYIYRLKTGSQTLSKKMIYLK